MKSIDDRKRALYDKKVSKVQQELEALKQDLMDALYLSDCLKNSELYSQLTSEDAYELLCGLYFRVPGQRPAVSKEIKEEVVKIEETNQNPVKVLNIGRPVTILCERK